MMTDDQAIHAALMLGTGAAAYAVMHAAHGLGDHWVQTHRCSQTKGEPGWPGRRACALHVTTYTLTMAVALVAVAIGTAVAVGLPWWSGAWHLLSPGHLAVAMVFTAVTHFVIDRRRPLEALARATGHAGFLAVGAARPGHDDPPMLGGSYALDQSAHVFLLFPAAAIIATGATV